MDAARIQALRFWEALDAFAQSQESAIADALTEAVNALRLRVTDEQLAAIIARGNVDALLQQIDFDAVRFALRNAVQAAAEQTPRGFTAANGSIAGQWPALIHVRFDGLAPYAVAALRDFESRAVDVIRQDIRGGFVAMLEEGLSAGRNPIDTARRIRDLVGLPDNLVRAGINYREALMSGNTSALRDALDRQLRDGRFDRSVLRAIADASPMDAERVDRMVAAYLRRAQQFNAETLARTASMDALNQGNRLAWRQAILDGKVMIHELRRFWVVARDERTCPRCLTIPQLNPEGRGMDEPFVTPYDGLVMIPTLHFRCFLPGTLVTAPGNILGATKRWFEGQIVRIRVGADNEIACTPNHPILTLRGWVPAGEITESDHVLQAVDPLRAVRSGGDPKNDNVEAPIEEFPDALAMAGGVRTVGVPVSAEDFHGDGVGSQQVDVVRSDSLLGNSLQSESGQPQGNVPLVATGAGALPSLTGGGAGGDFSGRMDATTGRVVRSARPSHPLFGADPSRLVPVPFGNGSDRQAELQEAVSDSLVVGAAFAGQLLQRFAGNVLAVKVSHVSIGEQFAGHVYNLEAEEGWYFANGIVAHNCRCVVYTRFDR